MMPNTLPQAHRPDIHRAAPVRGTARPRTKLDWAILASILLMLAMNAVALFGDLGPSTVYAAVPM